MQEASNLIDELSKLATTNERLEGFVKKYKTWFAFFEEILKTPEDEVLPKIHALVETSKIIVLPGLAEDFGIGDTSKVKFDYFLNFLSDEEKLFFSLAFEVTGLDDNLYQEHLTIDDDSAMDRFMELYDKSIELQEAEIANIMESFLSDNIEKLNGFFKKRIDLFYGARSKIIHNGSPDVIGAMLSSDMEVIMHYGKKENKFFLIKYPLEEFFVRAAYRITDHEPPKIKIKDFLRDNFLPRHARSSEQIIYKIEHKI